MNAALTSAALVAIAEIGDKTQLLALLLAARFRRPVPIILGMLSATMLNHALAGVVGGIVAATLAPEILRWALGLGFLAMAGWALVPDAPDERQVERRAAAGAFLASAVSFFLAEMGDKTQIATAALAARFGTILPVVAGTTIGMMAVDVPTVFFGHLAGHRLDRRWVRFVAAALFAIFGVAALLGLELF
jgi:Ca2+/H+ antiporter, TMEM165/GDT1 family